MESKKKLRTLFFEIFYPILFRQELIFFFTQKLSLILQHWHTVNFFKILVFQKMNFEKVSAFFQLSLFVS
jgi:hypothetical protein